MIHVFLGDNVEASRREFIQLKDDHKAKGYEIIPLTPDNLTELDRWLAQSTGLFADKKVFFGENLLAKKEHKTVLEKYDTTDPSVTIVLWEETLEPRLGKFIFKQAKFHASKLPHNIFQFLDAVWPTNGRTALTLLNAVATGVNEHLLLVMLQKRIRDLILLKQKLKPVKPLAQWQIARLQTQAGKWNEKRLFSFYDALYRIEVLTKTSAGYYSVKKALDISLLCSII